MMSAGDGQVIRLGRFSTTRSATPAAVGNASSPTKVASTTPGYVPAFIPARLTPARLASPASSVVASPTTLPFSLNVTIRPAIGAPEDVNDADITAVPP